ncbi:hypothetical protein LXL04_001567 [Taraxacum kok-saghyz]
MCLSRTAAVFPIKWLVFCCFYGVFEGGVFWSFLHGRLLVGCWFAACVSVWTAAVLSLNRLFYNASLAFLVGGAFWSLCGSCLRWVVGWLAAAVLVSAVLVEGFWGC